MTYFLMTLSGFFSSLAHTPYLDGYFFGTLCVVATIVVNAIVIDTIYSFGKKN